MQLQKHTDPIGKAVYDYWQIKEEKFVKIDCDVDEADDLPASYFFRDLAQMPELEKLALVQCKGSVLDVGAGAGCHSLLLHEMGHEVISIDISKYMCQVMEERGVAQVLNTGILEFSSSTFDTILLLMNGMGIAGTESELPNFLNHLQSLLNPNGKIIFESADIKESTLETDGSERIDVSKSYYGVVKYKATYNEIESNFNWLYIDQNRMREIVESVGLQMETIKETETKNYLAALTQVS